MLICGCKIQNAKDTLYQSKINENNCKTAKNIYK